jgi:hypothetical protein
MPYKKRFSAGAARRTSIVAGWSVIMMTVMQAVAAPGPIVLREQLNQTYGPELISIPFSAKNKECVVDGIQLAGPKGPVAVQLADNEFWAADSKFVKSAKLWFVADELKPLTSATYTPACGATKAPAVTTDLQVKPNSDNVEITTANIGVRLPLGGTTFPIPVPVKDVPGPLLAMRLGADAWAGGSAITGDVKIVKWQSRLTDNGPVFARVETTYSLTDSNTLTFSATVVAGDSAVRWSMSAQQDAAGAGVAWRLPPIPGVKQAIIPKPYGQWARDRQTALTPGDAPFCLLTPDASIANIFAEDAPSVRLAAEGGGAELQIASQDPGAWSEPVAPLTYAGFKLWELDNIDKMWDAWKRQRMPMRYAADGTVTLSATVNRGRRLWTISSGAPRVGTKLNDIKDLVLDWPANAARPTPRLFVGMPEIKDAWTRASSDATLMTTLMQGGGWASAVIPVLMKPADQRKPDEIERVVKPLRDQLALLGRFDVMRGAINTVTLYDMLIDSDLLTPADKALFRAQMAYLGYVMASPQCWSMERGYISGNPNMSCSYTLSLGAIACALSDHPAAKAWADYATQWMDKWLTDEVGTNGEWMPEGSHYSYVSLEPMVSYAIAAKRAGYHDFSNDARFKKLLLYFAKFNTSRDVQRQDKRSIAAYGRGHGGCMAVFGDAAPIFKTTDPTLSSTLQWMWSENGFPSSMADSRLGGLDPYYMDRRLPATPPIWNSELFPGIGALLRAGFNTPHESFLLALVSVQSKRNLDIWVPEVGGIAQWFGRGKPLSTCFTFEVGYAERHELLRNGVRLARNWAPPTDPKLPFGHYTETKFGIFTALPSVDYARSTFVNTTVDNRDWFPPNVPAYPKVTPAQGTNLIWTRQLLFMKDPDPAGPAWITLRDTVSGGQPTVWQFWTLSDKIGMPDQVKDAAAFLADKPGQTNLPARELPASDRYTALGQFGVDVEYFIASPIKTPRHTLRYGGMWAGNRIPEYQDLLHLQLPGDGAYCVAVFPRPRTEAVPTFTSLADGAIIKATGAFGIDFAFLSLDETKAEAEGAAFTGTAGSVQDRAGGPILGLGAPGSVRYKDYAIAAPGGASLQVQTDGLTISVIPSADAQSVTVTAPGKWTLARNAAAKLEKGEGSSLTVIIKAGASSAKLAKR